MSAWNEIPAIVNTITTVNLSVGAEGSDLIESIAGVDLSGHRMVVLNADNKAIYADNTEPSHTNKVLGMTIGSALTDTAVFVLNRGKLEEPSWNWTLDLPIFLSTSGNLTQTPPTTGFSLKVGFPITATSAYISIGIPLIL